MKGKHLAILLLLVAALGGAWLALSDRKGAAWSEKTGGGGKVLEFQPNDVARVLIKSSAGEVNLTRKADGWTVKERADYPANFEQVSALLRKLWDLKSVQTVKAGASQMSRLDLLEPGKGDRSALLVQLDSSGGKTLAALLLGKQYLRQSAGGAEGGFPAGRYVKPDAGNAIVSLVSETFNEVQPKPETWLSKNFIKVQEPIAISSAGKWKLTRETATAEWKLADAAPDEKLDPTKVNPMGAILSSPTFTDVQPPDAKLEEPATTANIDTAAGFHYGLKIGKAAADTYPVQVGVTADLPKERGAGKDEKPDDKTRLDADFAAKQKANQEKLDKEKALGARIYLVSKSAIEPLLRARADLLAPKPTPTPPPVPSPAAAPSPTPPSATTPPVSAPLPKK